MSQQPLTELSNTPPQRVEQQNLCANPTPPFRGGTNPILQLQRTMGNHHMAKLIKAKRLTPEGRIVGLQPKLTVGAADDEYEQEADRIARRVISIPESVASASPHHRSLVEGDTSPARIAKNKPMRPVDSITPPAQREIEGEEEETAPIQAKSAGSLSSTFEADANVESQIKRSKGRGSPLPDSVRSYMEPRFGIDFGHIRVHADTDAIQMNEAIGAKAFTQGSDIYYGAGRNPTNLELTAHELTHVVQQAGGDMVRPRHSDAAFSAPPIEIITPRESSYAQRDDEAPVDTPSLEPNPEEIWHEIERDVMRELLIKLQEIGRAAGTQTQDQINNLFSPYEDSLESDQTFLQFMSIPLGAGGNAPQGVSGGLIGGAVSAAAQFTMAQIMDFKSVGQVKARASADIGSRVTSLFTSNSELYMNFESDALGEIRDEFDNSWARMPPEAKSLPRDLIIRTYTGWYPMIARQKYGVESPLASSALRSTSAQVDRQLAPVREKLEELKSSQRWRRTGAGAVGGATAGALIGAGVGSVVPVLGTAVGGVIGGIIGGVAGVVGGWLW